MQSYLFAHLKELLVNKQQIINHLVLRENSTFRPFQRLLFQLPVPKVCKLDYY